jgi:CheY-like chemotaxis protein
MQTILCIDDQSDILELYKDILGSCGYDVLTASDGPTGIALTRVHSIDAVVLDFQMPGMNGRQVAEILSREQPALPVIISTGSTAQIPESLQRSARAVAEKGEDPRVLLSILQDTLNSDPDTTRIAV